MPSVAIIGASKDRAKYGNKAVRAYFDAGWNVFPINPKEKQVETLACYSSLASAPSADRVTLYVPPAVAVGLLKEIKAAGYQEVFVNPGVESDVLFSEAEKLGLKLVLTCSILAIGKRPSDY